MILALGACGNSDKASDGKVELNVIAAQYGTNTAAWWDNFVKEFEAEYENIDLNVEVVSWNDISTKVNTRISNDEAPDILNIDVFADYQADGLLLPAKDYVSEGQIVRVKITDIDTEGKRISLSIRAAMDDAE